MREEYQDAIVHQARMNQVQKSWSDFNDSSKISLEVRSAMCPYLLLEIRRENLINDTLKQLQEKVNSYFFLFIILMVLLNYYYCYDRFKVSTWYKITKFSFVVLKIQYKPCIINPIITLTPEVF